MAASKILGEDSANITPGGGAAAANANANVAAEGEGGGGDKAK